MLRLRVSTIRAWVLQRRVSFIKLGGKRVFFRKADLEALIVTSRVSAVVRPSCERGISGGTAAQKGRRL